MEKNQRKAKIEQVHVEEAARLKALFDERAKTSQMNFGAEHKIGSQGMVWQYLNARSPLNLDAAIKFANALKCDVAEFSPRLASLLEALQRTAREDAVTAYDVTLVTTHKNDKCENNVTINHYDTGGAMGDGGVILRDQPGLIASWTVTHEWLQKNIKSYTKFENLCVVTGFGDSMRPLYEPGDPLIVDTGVKTVDVDGIYFFRVGNEGFIKRLQRIPGEGIIAISENKAYRDWVIRPDMDMEVFGRVVKAWRSEDY